VALLLTWNVAGLDERLLDERTEAQCFAALLLRDTMPRFVLLQELVRRSWHAHWKHHLAHAGYAVFPEDPTKTPHEYFVALAVRTDLGPARGGRTPFPGSRMGRELVWAEVGGWLVCTGHLESERAGSPERVAQLGSVVQRLLAHPGPAVFGGDTNLRVEEEERVPGLSEVQDAWVAAGRPASERATWLGGKVGARFDRVLFNQHLRSTSFARLAAGPDALTGLILSDHAGLLVDLEPVGA
jgi:endonuclease/exonuclease/phosphatase family metal-dependent hydrolase